MLFTISVSLLIIYHFQSPQCNALPDQWNAWRNPYYRDNYGQDVATTTTTTTRPLYPTLYPSYYPTAPIDPNGNPNANPNANPHSNYDFDQRQGPVNPFTGEPLQPQHPQQPNRPHQPNNPHQPYHPRYDNFDRNRNQTFENRIGYNNDNNTRSHTTYPPFDGFTRRNTFPTRRNFNTMPPITNQQNSTWHRNPNNTFPQYNNNPHHQDHSYRPFPSSPFPSSPFPSNPPPNSQRNDGRNQFHGNYQPQYPNMNNFVTSRNSITTPPISYEHTTYRPSQPSQPSQPLQPDYHPSGVALAPFPGDATNANKFGTRQNFNYDNLYRRQPQSSSFDNGGSSQVPLAGYGGAYVPLAPL